MTTNPDVNIHIENKAEAVVHGGIRGFLKEYWLWIVIPFALVVGGLAIAWFLMSDDGASPFVYNIY